MTKKRKNNSSYAPDAKRHRDSHVGSYDASQPRVNPDIGQKGALPGLDDDAELSDELSNDAIAYLRSVRYDAPFTTSMF